MDNVTKVKLSDIRTDGGTQMRAELSTEVFMDYRDKWLAGVQFDAVDLFFDGSTYWLADGFHRFYGAREAKLKTIPANVHQGTVRDAILFACGANTSHGMRRTNADKRRAVETLLSDEEWCQWSDRQVAEQAGVGVDLVGSVRRQLSENDSSSPAAQSAHAPRKGKDGKKRRQPKRNAAPAPPDEADHAEPEPRPEGPPSQQQSPKFKQFLALWAQCDEVAKAAIRAHVLGDNQ